MKEYFLIDSLDKLKEEINGPRKKLFYKLVEQGELYHTMNLSLTPPKESTTYFCQAIMNLSLLYLLTDEERYLNDLERFIKIVCSYPYWGNAHLVNVDLSASWILFGLSISYQWLNDVFSSELRKILLDKLILQSQIMYKYKMENDTGWPVNYFQNHNWINMTGLAACGYAIKDEFPKALSYIEIAEKDISTVFDCLAEDGSDYEGVTYWRYGVLWLMIYADLYNDRTKKNLFKKSKFLENTFFYRLYQSASNLHMQLNFGDCHDRHSSNSIAMYYKFASEYNNGYAQYMGDLILNDHYYEEQYLSKIKPGIMPEAWLSFLWYNPSIISKNPNELPLYRKFDDLGLIAIRNGFDEDSIVFSIKCGYPGGKKQWKIGTEYYKQTKNKIMALSHHHSDNLGYIITKGNSYMVIDDGYNRNIMPKNHSVLLVDGVYSDAANCSDVYLDSLKKRLEKNPNYNISKYYGSVDKFYCFDKLYIAKLSNQAIYPLEFRMNEVSRTLISDNLDYIIYINRFVSEDKHIYQSIINTEPKAIKDKNKNVYNIKNGLESMKYMAYFDSDYIIKEYVQDVSGIMTTQEPDKVCKTTLYTLEAKTLTPCKEAIGVEIINLNNVDIRYENNRVIIDNKRIICYKKDQTFDFDGELLMADFLENKITNVIMLNASYLNINGRNVIYSNMKQDIKQGGLNEVFE